MSCLVSVVIPAFNAESFIGDALQSVRVQKHRPLEVIVVDDGSTDNTEAVVRSAAEQTSVGFEIRYLRQKNGGPSSARNTGIKAARGTWIAFLDADDIWIEDKLSLQMDYLKAHDDVTLIFGDMEIFSEGTVLVPSAYECYGYPQCDENGILLDPFRRLVASNPIFTGTLIVRRDCFDSVGLFDETIKYGEDYDMWLRLALLYPLACIPKVLMSRRKHDSNLSGVEEFFYYSKLYILEKLCNHPLVDATRCKIALDGYLATKKEISYWFFLRKRYFRALNAIVSFGISHVHINLLRLPLRDIYKAGSL